MFFVFKEDIVLSNIIQIKKWKRYYRNFPYYITFKFNDDYKLILSAEKGHFYLFEETSRSLDPQELPRSCAPVLKNF